MYCVSPFQVRHTSTSCLPRCGIHFVSKLIKERCYHKLQLLHVAFLLVKHNTDTVSWNIKLIWFKQNWKSCLSQFIIIYFLQALYSWNCTQSIEHFFLRNLNENGLLAYVHFFFFKLYCWNAWKNKNNPQWFYDILIKSCFFIQNLSPIYYFCVWKNDEAVAVIFVTNNILMYMCVCVYQYFLLKPFYLNSLSADFNILLFLSLYDNFRPKNKVHSFKHYCESIKLGFILSIYFDISSIFSEW